MRIPGLDGLRAVSIALVLAHHAAMTPGVPPALGRAIKAVTPGSLGVYVFFTISGFLITNLLLDEEQQFGHLDLKRFYARRFLRLMPAYFVFLAALWILGRQYDLGTTRGEFLTALTYVRNYYSGGTWFTGHLWSLAVEEQFYFLWPAALFLARGRVRLGLAVGVLLFAPCARVACYLSGWPTLSAVAFPCVADPIMAGCLLAMLTRRSSRLVPMAPVGIGRGVAVVVLVAVAIFEQAGRFGPVLLPFGLSLMSACVAYLVWSYAFGQPGVSARCLAHPVARWLGLLSYSVYLWQQLFLAPTAVPYLGPLSASLPAKLVLVILCASASYYGLERPLIRVRERLRRRRATDGAGDGDSLLRESAVGQQG